MIPPFYIGQKVVCVKTSVREVYKEGELYVVRELIRCPKCGEWLVGCTPHNLQTPKFTHSCGSEFPATSYWVVNHYSFTHLFHNYKSVTFQDITELERVSEN
jgi:hypothetical protein